MMRDSHIGFGRLFTMIPAGLARTAVMSALLGICLAGPAHGQHCRELELELIGSPPSADTVNHNFGQSIDIDGDWAIVHAPNTSAGKAVILHRDNGAWSVTQTLPAPGPGSGRSVAISGDVVVIAQISVPRVALVYRLVGEEWTFEQQLEPPVDWNGFAESVEVQGNTILVGDTQWRISSDPTPIRRGGAHVYDFNGTAWTYQQTLVPEPDSQWIALGHSVSLDGDVAIVGQATGFTSLIPDAVHVFSRKGGVWSPQQRLLPADGITTGKFGSVLQVLGDRMVIGRRGNGDPSSAGEVHAYAFDGTSWTLEQVIAPHDLQYCCQSFGGSLAMHGDRLAVGSPTLAVDYPNYPQPADRAGGVTIYERQGPSWIPARNLRERLNFTHWPGGVPWVHHDAMGAAVAVDDTDILVGVPMPSSNNAGRRARAALQRRWRP